MDPPSRLDKLRVRHAFDRAAPDYDEAAVLQREVGSRLLERLDLVRLRPNLICDIGCGTGVAARDLMRRYRRAQLVGIDLAPRMLAIARRRKPLLRKLWVVCGDTEALPLVDGCCDLAFSNLSLDWCQDIGHAFAEFYRVLRPGGLLMFSTFGPDTLKELRACWRSADGHGHVNTFLDMHDVGDAMVRAGLADPVLDVEHFTMTYRDVSSLTKDLKAVGGSNAIVNRPRGLTGRGRWQSMINAYEAYRAAGVLPATYEVVYGHGWRVDRPVRSARRDGSSRVPVSAIAKRGRRS